MFFSVVSAGPGQTVLIVSQNKVTPAEIKEAQAELGGGKEVAKGHVEGNPDGALVFQVAGTAPPNLKTALRLAIKEQAKMSLDVEVVSGKESEGTGEGETPPGGPPRRPGISDEAAEQFGALMAEANQELGRRRTPTGRN